MTIEIYPHSVSDTRLDILMKNGYLPDPDSLKSIGSAAGNSNVYCCTLDWRMGQLDCAEVLNDYIEDVLSATNSEKVNLCGVSFGGQVIASYLSIYGGNKANHVVLNSPALDGSSIVSQLLSEERFGIEWKDALELYTAYSKTETPWTDLAYMIKPELLNDFLRAFFERFLVDFFVNFPSVWDLVPLKDYEQLKAKYIQDEQHKRILDNSDTYHYEIAANRSEIFKELEDEGVSISIICGYNFAEIASSSINSDGVIEVSSMTGADASDIGKTLSNAQCESSNRISACRTIDASTSYLPEHTWFVCDMLHGLGCLENKIGTLINTLLLTDEIKAINSSPLYPQFMSSRNMCRGVVGDFSSCSEGYVTPYSTQFTITNVSKTQSITVDRIDCSYKDIQFEFVKGTVILPGETLTVDVYGKLPLYSEQSLSVSIGYIIKSNGISIAKSRSQSFFISDGSNERIMLDAPDETTQIITTKTIERKSIVSFSEFLARIVHIVYMFLIRR